jgi:fatty acid desaturase
VKAFKKKVGLRPDVTTWPVYDKRPKRFRSDANTQKKLRELNRLDNWHGPLALSYDYAVIAAVVTLTVGVSWWFYPVALLVIGSRMRALATVLHESAHGVLASSKRLNTALGSVLSGYLIFQLYFPYRKSHVNTHHPMLGDPTRDPDLRYFIDNGVYDSSLTVRQRFMRFVLIPVVGGRTVSTLRYLLGNRLFYRGGGEGRQPVTSKERADQFAFTATWVVILAVVAGTGQWLALLLFWVVPYLTTFAIITWFIELAEHTPLVRDSDENIYMTRNRKSRGVEWFLTSMHGENYHLDHHLDPRTPFWNMRRANRIRAAHDPVYKGWDDQAGGLFHRGPQGQPAAVWRIVTDCPELPRAGVDRNRIGAQ